MVNQSINQKVLRTLVLLVVASCAVLFTYFSHRALQRQLMGSTDDDKTLKKRYQQTFNEMPFVELRDERDVATVASQCEIRGANDISDTQVAALRSSLHEMLNCLTVGGAARFHAFRLPSGVPYSLNPQYFDLLRKYYQRQLPGALDVKLLEQALSDSSEKRFYKGFLTGVCHSEAKMRQRLPRVNAFGQQVQTGVWVAKMPKLVNYGESAMVDLHTIGTDAVANLATLSPTPAEILSEEGAVQYAFVYWVVRPNPELERGMAFPLVAQFYWSSRWSRWLPLALVRANVWNYEKIRIHILF